MGVNDSHFSSFDPTMQSLLLSSLLLRLLFTSCVTAGSVYVKLPDIPGEVVTKGFPDDGVKAIEVLSFGGLEIRDDGGETGGEKGGELRTLNITKRVDQSSPSLFLAGASGNSANSGGPCEICIVHKRRTDPNAVLALTDCDILYELERVFVTSYKQSSSGGQGDDIPTEEVAFYYNKIAFTYKPGTPDVVSAGWNVRRDRIWTDHNTHDPGVARKK